MSKEPGKTRQGKRLLSKSGKTSKRGMSVGGAEGTSETLSDKSLSPEQIYLKERMKAMTQEVEDLQRMQESMSEFKRPLESIKETMSGTDSEREEDHDTNSPDTMAYSNTHDDISLPSLSSSQPGRSPRPTLNLGSRLDAPSFKPQSFQRSPQPIPPQPVVAPVDPMALITTLWTL